MSERDAIVAVTEADREAYLSLNMLPGFDAADVRAGRWDKVAGLQAFARHRATHAGEVERLREAIEMALTCTPQGDVVYDCGDPWAILRDALEASR